MIQRMYTTRLLKILNSIPEEKDIATFNFNNLKDQINVLPKDFQELLQNEIYDNFLILPTTEAHQSLFSHYYNTIFSNFQHLIKPLLIEEYYKETPTPLYSKISEVVTLLDNYFGTLVITLINCRIEFNIPYSDSIIPTFKLPYFDTPPHPQKNSNTLSTFYKIPINIIKDHFKPLVHTGALTEDTLNQFINCIKSGTSANSKLKLKYSKQVTRAIIINSFYRLYAEVLPEFDSKTKKRSEFIKLLTDNFNGYDFTSVSHNFK